MIKNWGLFNEAMSIDKETLEDILQPMKDMGVFFRLVNIIENNGQWETIDESDMESVSGVGIRVLIDYDDNYEDDEEPWLFGMREVGISSPSDLSKFAKFITTTSLIVNRLTSKFNLTLLWIGYEESNITINFSKPATKHDAISISYEVLHFSLSELDGGDGYNWMTMVNDLENRFDMNDVEVDGELDDTESQIFIKFTGNLSLDDFKKRFIKYINEDFGKFTCEYSQFDNNSFIVKNIILSDIKFKY